MCTFCPLYFASHSLPTIARGSPRVGNGCDLRWYFQRSWLRLQRRCLCDNQRSHRDVEELGYTQRAGAKREEIYIPTRNHGIEEGGFKESSCVGRGRFGW